MTVVAWCLLVVGTGAMALSALAATVAPGVLDRLHLLTVTTSVGVPLIGVGLVIVLGIGTAAATIAVTTAVVVLSAPVMSPATARLTAQYAGVVGEDSPS